MTEHNRLQWKVLLPGLLLFVATSSAQQTPVAGLWDPSFGPEEFGGNELNSFVKAIARDPITGDIYVGGSFSRAANEPDARYVARWTGSSWEPLGGGLTGQVEDLAFDSSGNLYAAGNFVRATQSDGSTIVVNDVARWDGTVWHSLGGGLGGTANEVEFDPSTGVVYFAGIGFDSGENVDGTIVASPRIIRWNGTVWEPVGQGLSTSGPSWVDALAVNPANGDVIVGGVYTRDVLNSDGTAVPSYGIALWDGEKWTSLRQPGDAGHVEVLTFDPSGRLWAGGYFTTIGGVDANGLAYWDGATWVADAGGRTNGRIDAIDFVGSDVFIGGDFTRVVNPDGTTADRFRIAQWDGTRWQPLGSGVYAPPANYPGVYALLAAGTDVYVGGRFYQAGGIPSLWFARWKAVPPSWTAAYATFRLDLTRAQRFKVPESNSQPFVNVYTGDRAGRYFLYDPDGDSVWTARVAQPVGVPIRHLFGLDLNGDGFDAVSHGVDRDWLLERTGTESGARTTTIPSSEAVSFQVVAFDDLDLPAFRTDFEGFQNAPRGAGNPAPLKQSLYAGQGFNVTTDFASLDRTVQVASRLYFGGPGGAMPPGIAVLADNVFYGFEVSPYRAVYVADLTIEYRYITGVSQPNDLRVLYRGTAVDPWEIIPAEVDIVAETITAASVTKLTGEWVLGSTSSINTLSSYPPPVPSDPSPGDGVLSVPAQPTLRWAESRDAFGYVVYLWPQTDPRPGTPVARPNEPHYAASLLTADTWYNWQVIAENVNGVTEGPIWSFRVGQVPDLEVTSIIAPTEAFSGQPIQISWTVANVGQKATNVPRWFDQVYLSKRSTLVRETATLLVSKPNLAFLNPGESYTNTVPLLLPDGVSGTHYVHVAADGKGRGELIEGDEENNILASQPISVTLTPFADLEVVDVIAPDIVFSGDSIDVSWTVRNVGNGQTDVSEWSDAVFLSDDDVFDYNFTQADAVIRINENLLASRDHSGSLETGEEYAASARLKLPDASVGDLYLFVATDTRGGAKQKTRGDVYEFNEELDNWTSEAIRITLTPPPDLVVSQVVAPASAQSGQTVDLTWTVLNTGPGATAATSWSDLIYLSPTAQFDSSTAVVLGSFGRQGVLLNDSTYTRSASVRVPDGVTGPGFFIVTTDWTDRVFEHTFENNNSGSNVVATQVAIAPYPDLQVESASASPPTVSAGQQVAIRYAVRNTGNLVTSGAWTDSIFVSHQADWDRAQALAVGSAVQQVALDPGALRSRTTTVVLPPDLDGDYYVFVRANASDAFFEYPNTEQSVARSGLVAVSAYPPVDLTAELEPIVSPVRSGESVIISATVRNAGAARTRSGGWIDRVYLSTDTEIEPEIDIVLAEPLREGALAGGASYRFSRPLDIPNGLEGDYFVLFVADADSVESETDETNNGSAAALSLTLPTPSDLRITQFVAPDTAQAGQPVNISWTVQNAGVGVTVGDFWYDAVYLSADRVVGRNDVVLGTQRREGTLDAASSYEVSVRAALPVFAGGTYYLIAQADTRDDVYEHLAEGNNVNLAQIELTLPDPTDLVVEDVVAPLEAEPGQSVAVSWTVRNAGINAATGLVRDAVFVSEDTEWSADDLLLGVLEREIDLAPGASGKVAMTVDVATTFQMDAQGNITEELPGVAPGDYYVIVRADAGNAIRETEDGNNSAASPGTIATTVPTLSVGTPRTLTLGAGQSRYYRVDVTADADARLTIDSDTPESGNELYVAAGRMPVAGGDYDYAAAEPFMADQELVIPSTGPGSYYLLVVTRSVPQGVTQTLILTQESPGFEIESVSPSVVGQGRVTTTVVGTALRDLEEVYLSGGEGSTVAGVVTGNPTSTVSTIQWDLASVQPGTYDLTIVRSGGEIATRTGSVEVVAATDLTTYVEILGPSRIRAEGSAEFLISMENTSNVDIPHVALSVYANRTESMAIDSDLFSLDGFLPSDVLADELKNDVFLDPTDALIPLVGRNLQPGEKRTASIRFSGFYDPQFEVSAQAVALTSEQALGAWTASFEAVRQEILGEPDFDPVFVTLAEDPERFRNTMLFNLAQYGLIDELDIPRPAAGKATRAGKMQRIAAGGPCFCVEYDVDFETGEPTCVRAECPPNQPSIGPLPPGFPEPPGGPPLTCEQQREQTQACVDRWTNRCRAPVTCLGSIASCAFKTKVWWAGPACGVLCAMVKHTEICDPNWSTSVPRLICPPVDSSCDPNDIVGPDGFSDDKWVSRDQTLPYTIRFENDPSRATASAQVVGITHPLDPAVDERSFRLGEFGFGPLIFEPPANSAFFRDRVDATDSLGVLVDVTAGIDVTRNEAFWRFTSIDPATGDQPINDPTAGFLPVNDDRGSGEGFVTYTIRADEDAPTGDVIDAQAEIVFDINAPIETPAIFNTLDASPPTSAVNVLTNRQDSVVFDISWTGQDAGSGVRDFALYRSIDWGPFEAVETAVTDTTRLFVGEIGHNYQFFTIARDNAGNVEPMKTEAEAVTVVSTEDRDSELPQEFALHQNYPNPFNPTTTIPFDLAENGEVELTLFDVLGRRVLTVDRGSLAAGRYQQIVDLSRFASGVYLYQIRVTSDRSIRFRDVGKLILVK